MWFLNEINPVQILFIKKYIYVFDYEENLFNPSLRTCFKQDF